MTEHHKDALALAGVLEWVEGCLPSFPQEDHPAWREALVRLHALKLRLRVGEVAPL